MANTPEHMKNIGHSTRFGAEKANKRSQEIPGANKAWSIRGSLKYAAAAEIDPEDIHRLKMHEITEDELIFKILGKRKATLAQIGATRQMIRYMRTNADSAFVTEQVDGRLSQMNINSEMSSLLGMTDEQLEQIASGLATINDDSAHEGGSGYGASEEEGNAPDSSGEDGGD